MKTKFIAGLIALTFTVSGSAFAQRGDHGNDRDHDRNGYSQQHDDRRNNGGSRAHGNKHRNDSAQYYRRDDTRGGGPRHDLRRGGKLHKEYRNKRYVVNDWRGRHLNAPPRGYHWVQTGNDYVLAAIASGIIAQVLFAN
ncbi:Ni/Co efflux regulator RcnB [Massilia sp. MP_M2]|uniref:RcnB family protein n=1 Tax=Massilia sp. MP_M2 TaxID=3071713 RepID=UPI00319EA711